MQDTSTLALAPHEARLAPPALIFSEPQRFVRAIAGHRRAREAAILQRLKGGDGRIAEIVPKLYEGLRPELHGAAALSVFAHVEDLVGRGLVVSDGPVALDGLYRAA